MRKTGKADPGAFPIPNEIPTHRVKILKKMVQVERGSFENKKLICGSIFIFITETQPWRPAPRTDQLLRSFISTELELSLTR